MPLIPIAGLLNFYMKKAFVISVVSIAFLSLALSACKNTLTPGIDQIVFPTSGTVGYNEYVQPLFNIACNYSGCHDAADAAGGLDLTSYFSMISSSPAPVQAGDTTHSILIQRIEGKGPIMPPAGFGSLTPNQIQGLKAWIIQGAKPK
jgi:predicted small secreted protein